MRGSSGPVRVIALDIDGTLLDSRKKISSRNLKAIAEARRRGIRVVLVTGRRYPAAKRIADEIPGSETLILHNGGLVMEEGTPIRVRPLLRGVATQVVEFGKTAGADPVVHVGLRGEGLLYVETSSPSHTLLAYYLAKSHPDVRVVDRLEAAIAEHRDDPLQVMFGGSIPMMSVTTAAARFRSASPSSM